MCTVASATSDPAKPPTARPAITGTTPLGTSRTCGRIHAAKAPIRAEANLALIVTVCRDRLQRGRQSSRRSSRKRAVGTFASRRVRRRWRRCGPRPQTRASFSRRSRPVYRDRGPGAPLLGQAGQVRIRPGNLQQLRLAPADRRSGQRSAQRRQRSFHSKLPRPVRLSLPCCR